MRTHRLRRGAPRYSRADWAEPALLPGAQIGPATCKSCSLTAHDTPEDTITGLSVVGDDYVTKPFGLEEQHVIGLPAPLRATLWPQPAPLAIAVLLAEGMITAVPVETSKPTVLTRKNLLPVLALVNPIRTVASGGGAG